MTSPRGWARTTLGEVLELNPKHAGEGDRDTLVSFVPMPAVDEVTGKIGDTEVRPLRDVWTGYTHLADGDVIFAKITPCMENGKVAVVTGMMNGLACGSTEFFVLRSTGAVIPALIWRMLRQPSFRRAAEQRMTGAVGQRRVPRKYIEEYGFTLPPLAEQRRIVAKLDTLTACIARARAELVRVPRLVQKIKKQALAICFASASDRAPIMLGTILKGIQAGKNLRCEERPPHSGELGVVKVSAVTWGRFDPTKAKTLPPDYIPSEAARIRAGDLLMSRANTIELVGAVAMVEDAPRDLFLSDKILRLMMPEDAKRWVQWFLRSPSGREQIERMATGNQLSMRNLSQDALRRIELPFPDAATRLSAVHELEAAFARAENLQSEAARATKFLDRLEASILAKAFQGELVPQDPADEPVAALLDRIRAERAAAPSPKRGRRAAASGP